MGSSRDRICDAIEMLRSLSEEERLKVLSEFCENCGTYDSRCRCWDDE